MKTKLFLIAMVMILAACAPGGTPQLIGSAPRAGEGGLPPINTLPPIPPADVTFVYNAAADVSVEYVWRARWAAEQIATELGGRVVSQRWVDVQGNVAELVMIVPAGQLDAALNRLHTLGTVNDSDKYATVQSGGAYGSSSLYSAITLTLREYWWVDVRDWAFWIAVIGTPVVLMLIGLITVLRWVGRWLRRLQAGPTASNVEQRMAEVVKG